MPGLSRASRLFLLVCLAAVAGATVPVKAQTSMEISDLRQRISQIEQQLFQARMNSGQSYPAIDQLNARISQLERDIASQRITDTSNAVVGSARRSETASTLAARVAELERQRDADAALIKTLTKRIEALEKPVAKPRVIRR